MKKIINILLATVAAFTAFSCGDKASLGLTEITYFAQIEVLGDADIVVQKGSQYVDAGCKATMKGEDVTSQVKVSSNVNTAVSGVYSVQYSVVNEDGFEKVASRKVTVLDLNDAVEGFYTAQKISVNGSNKYEGPHQVLVIGLGGGKYSVSDLLGGWYDQGRGYGGSYAMTGTISISGTEVSLVSSFIAGWGDGLDPGFVGTFDPDTKTLSWNTSYADMPCIIVLQKN